MTPNFSKFHWTSILERRLDKTGTPGQVLQGTTRICRRIKVNKEAEECWAGVFINYKITKTLFRLKRSSLFLSTVCCLESGEWAFSPKSVLCPCTPRRLSLSFFAPRARFSVQTCEYRLYIILLPGTILALKLRKSTLWVEAKKKMDKSFDISPFCLNPKIRSAHSCRWADTCLDSNAYEIIRLHYGQIPRDSVGSV